MSVVKKGLVVQLEVDLKVKDGEVIESSKKSGIVAYTHGSGQMLPGLEKQLEGMAAGEEKSGVIAAADAFGTPESQAKMHIPRAEFPKDAKIAVGDRFEAKGPTGTPVTLNVTEVTDEKVTAQVVHPLAGKDIEFRVKVVSVKPPLPQRAAIEEIEPEADSKK
jgi:FKBP-type peptidyl-prolyl cis-trans isomerase 2